MGKTVSAKDFNNVFQEKFFTCAYIDNSLGEEYNLCETGLNEKQMNNPVPEGGSFGGIDFYPLRCLGHVINSETDSNCQLSYIRLVTIPDEADVYIGGGRRMYTSNKLIASHKFRWDDQQDLCYLVMSSYIRGVTVYQLDFKVWTLKTPELCLATVMIDGNYLEDVPENLKSDKVCVAAVTQNGYAIRFVPMPLRTLELYTVAMNQLQERWTKACQPSEFFY